MKKEKLIETIVAQSGVDKKHVNAVLKAFTQIIANELKEEGKFQISGLGSFKVCTRKSCINPKTKEKIDKEVHYVTFTQGQQIRNTLNS